MSAGAGAGSAEIALGGGGWIDGAAGSERGGARSFSGDDTLGATGAPPNLRKIAAPGEVVSSPGANLIPDPGSDDSRRNVTSRPPHEPSPRCAPRPPADVPNTSSTSACSSIEMSTKRNSSDDSRVAGASRGRAKLRRVVKSGECGRVQTRVG